MSKRGGLILNRLLRAWQFRCALRKALSCRGEIGIECERHFEGNNCAPMLIECREIAPAVDQHDGIVRQYLEVNRVVFLKPHSPFRQNTRSIPKIYRIITT